MWTDWAYYEGVEWSDFSENVPDFSEEHWKRSEKTPTANEKRTLLVYKPFDESPGNEFLALFETALIFFNGWDECYKNDIDKCALVRCKFERVLKHDEYMAWIVVSIQDVIHLDKLCDYYKPYETEKDIELFDGIPEHMNELLFRNNHFFLETIFINSF